MIVILLIAILPVLLGLILLVAFSFPNLAFNLGSWETYAIVAAFSLVLVGLCGRSISSGFERSLMGFLEGKKLDPLDDKGLNRSYGCLVLSLFPILLYVQLLALYSAMTIVWWALPRVPVILTGGFVIVVAVGLYRVIFPPARNPIGAALRQTEQPRLRGLVTALTSELDCLPIDRIIITPFSGIDVYLEGGLFATMFGRRCRTVSVGIPSLHGLFVDEFRAVLARECSYALCHASRWAALTYSLGHVLLASLQSMQGASNKAARIAARLDPSYWTLLLYWRLFLRITGGFSRIQEALADRRAITLYGGDAFSSGLQKAAVNDSVFNAVADSLYVMALLGEEKTVSNPSGFMEEVFLHLLSSEDLQTLTARAMLAGKSRSAYDSHFILSQRIDYAQKLGSGPPIRPVSVTTLFDNWDDLNDRAAAPYRARLKAELAASLQRAQAMSKNKGAI